ncbi:MAG: LEA type 2 family protein, partial [Hymenobacteraceae bacterium]|nr:LEA type 2 family protein [Hymenobacteraceae bacterium]MDX5395663.1 LEA type 2 family protein [Hymenobacteraceae bacterium]MDX5511716.1 LEA type 2 family protein [Hymenobacteraceae bacterium]
EEVTYLKVELGQDTAEVHAGIKVQNRAPVSFHVDSVNYQIRNNGKKLGWGNQLVGQTLPALKDKVLDFKLMLKSELYREHLSQKQGHDSLDLEVLMQIYIDHPLLQQQTITLNRTLTTAVPKAPAIKIDTFFVKSFSPDAGYTFQLNLNACNTNLPDLRIEDFSYSIRLSDSMVISGEVDSTFRIRKGNKVVQVPIHLETSEMVELLRAKLSDKNVWPYEAKASAVIKTDHRLFESTDVLVTKSGTLDTRKLAGSSVKMPSVKKVQSLKLVAKEKSTYLQADLLIHNATKLPLYIDSARYVVRYKGKVLARGAGDFEKVLPAKDNQSLQLQLTVNNKQYNQLMNQPQENGKVPLDVELQLHYNLKGSKPQLITIKEKMAVPVTKGPTFEVVDIGIKQLDPEKGAQLLLQVKAANPGGNKLTIDDLNYRLVLRKDIVVTGKTKQPIAIKPDTSIIEVPVDLSADNVNMLTKGLIQGVETWDYTFSGTATISAENTILQQTEVALQTSGVYEVKSKGTPDFMPEISKIDTLYVTIHYDTAWVHMYAAIYNTLPVTIHVSQLQVDVLHQSDTIGKTEEELDLALAPNANTFDWHTLGVNYKEWEEHLKHHQDQDSIQLILPAVLTYELSNLGQQHVEMDWSTKIPTPATPVTLLQKLKLRGFGFRTGLTFDALVTVQNANSDGLTVKNIDYQITMENGVDICGKINRTYFIPLGVSQVEVPVNLSVWEALKLLTRQLFGPPMINYKINATAEVQANNPKLKSVHVIFENHNQSNLNKKKRLNSQLPQN